MWTRGKDKQQEGKFEYSLYGADGELIKTVGGFETHSDADRAAEFEQRLALSVFAPRNNETLDDLDDILAELNI